MKNQRNIKIILNVSVKENGNKSIEKESDAFTSKKEAKFKGIHLRKKEINIYVVCRMV